LAQNDAGSFDASSRLAGCFGTEILPTKNQHHHWILRTARKQDHPLSLIDAPVHTVVQNGLFCFYGINPGMKIKEFKVVITHPLLHA